MQWHLCDEHPGQWTLPGYYSLAFLNWRAKLRQSCWQSKITTYHNYQLHFLPTYNTQTHLGGLNDILCRWLVTNKQNQLSQWSQSQIHLANHCENRLRLSVGRPYEKNRDKTTFFSPRQIPDDQEDAVCREVLRLTRTTRQVKHTQTQLRTKVLIIPWAVQMWAGWTQC